MTLPSSGTITLAMIQTEFGGPTPIVLSNYYRGGSYVTANNTSIPTSGTLTIPNTFFGAQKFSATTHAYTTAGSGTETIPAGSTTMVIEIWGGGGSGGAGAGSGCTTHGGGGGGAGGYSRSSYSVSAYAGQTMNYTVGALGPPSDTAGTASTVSSGTFSLTTMTANGGAGGVNGGAGAGGAGGTASGGNQANTTGARAELAVQEILAVAAEQP